MRTFYRKLIATLAFAFFVVCVAYAQTTQITHIVAEGETLESIAQRYHTTKKDIVKMNPKAALLFYVGMQLKISVEDKQKQKEIGSTNNKNTNTVKVEKEKDNKETKDKSFVYSGDLDTPIPHQGLFSIYYLISNFSQSKESGSYGFQGDITSLTHRNNTHIGFSWGVSTNLGLVDSPSAIISLGPSVRFDITENIFFNLPVIASMGITYSTGESNRTESKTSWAIRVAPSFYFFFSEGCGVFLAPQACIGLQSGSETTYGMACGLTFGL